MHVRVVTVGGATRIDDGIEFFRDRVLREMRGLKGFQGLTVAGDRSTDTVEALTVWETEDDMRASESTSASLRNEVLAITGGELTVETYEQVLEEVGEVPPTEGCAIRIQGTQMDPAHVDDNVAFFKAQVLPQMKAAPGFRALRNLVDRTSGHGVVRSVWDDRALIEAEDQRYQGRERAATQGVQFKEWSVRDIFFSAS